MYQITSPSDLLDEIAEEDTRVHPQVAAVDLFRHSHNAAWPQLVDDERRPSLFERRTADALWHAYERSLQGARRFTAVSAATGAGKSLGAQCLMAHLYPARTAIVIREIREAHQAYLNLCRLIGEDNVAIHTSLHKTGADRREVETFETETGYTIRQQFTEEDFRSAPVVICTHKRWKGEHDTNTDRGVRLCNGEPRDLIIIDEDPELERLYVAQPEHVATLASVLTDTVTADEARRYGFTESHPAVGPLRDLSHRLGRIKDNANRALQTDTELVPEEHVETLLSITREDVYKRLAHLETYERMNRADELDQVRHFVAAVCEGRVFYNKQARGGQFYAYSYAVPPERNTIILDGTADLNGLYSVGDSVVTLEAPDADYRDVELYYHELPAEMSGQRFWHKDHIRKRKVAEPVMEWFEGFLREHTEPGESVLVYAAKHWLDTALMDRETDFEGRRVYWQHFGAGRGTNDYRSCDVYVQVRAHYKPRAVTIAQIGSYTGETFSDDQLATLSSGKTSDETYVTVRDTLVACDTKQNAARTCIRQLDDQGRAKSARLYFVGDNPTFLVDHLPEMFPGAGQLEFLTEDRPPDPEDSTGPERLAYLLASTEETVVTFTEICDLASIRKQHVRNALKAPKVRAVMEARGWAETSLKDLGRPGKGRALWRK